MLKFLKSNQKQPCKAPNWLLLGQVTILFVLFFLKVQYCLQNNEEFIVSKNKITNSSEDT